MKDRVRVNAARVGLVMQESSKEAVSYEAYARWQLPCVAGFAADAHVLPCSAWLCDRESFRNTPRGGHEKAGETAPGDDGDTGASTAEIAQRMREGKGSGILGGSGVA